MNTVMSMVKFRFVGDEPRVVSIMPTGELRRMEPDQLFEVDGEHWESYACQPHLFTALDEDPQRQGIDQVLADVGDDRDAAAQALDAERRSPKPRRSLLRKLEEVATREPAALAESPDHPREPVPAQPGATVPAFVEPGAAEAAPDQVDAVPAAETSTARK